MTTEEILDKARGIAFFMELYDNASIENITNVINRKLADELEENYNLQNNNSLPKFSQTQVKTMLDYENLVYMMSTARKCNESAEDFDIDIAEAVKDYNYQETEGEEHN